MQSMTGCGSGKVQRDGWEVTVDVKTVNHRFLDAIRSIDDDAVGMSAVGSDSTGLADRSATFVGAIDRAIVGQTVQAVCR